MSDLILTEFVFNAMPVRVVQADGEPWFVAADVCAVLGLGNVSMALERLDDDEKGVSSIDTLGGAQQMAVINESGLYSLVLGSRKPEAKPFKKWVTAEVLPSIRKTGAYSVTQEAIPQTYAQALRAHADAVEAKEQAEERARIAIATKAQIGSSREATCMATASAAVRKANSLQRQLDRARDYATVKRMQMLYHGQRFNWRLLRDASAEMGIAPVDVFDANYGTVKAYHADVWMAAYAVEIDGAEVAE